MGDNKMNKRFLVALIGVLLFAMLIFSGLFVISNFFIVGSESSSTFKTMSFDGITASVPLNSNFVADTNFHDDVNHGIYIMTYNDKADKKFINETIDSFIPS